MDEAVVAGTGGLSQRVTVYAAVVDVGDSQWPTQILALAGEPLVGRDLLNQWTATLRGPAHVLEIEAPDRGPRAR